MLYSSSSISIRFSIGIPCTIAASSSVSPWEAGQPSQCIPISIRTDAAFISMRSTSPIVISLLNLLIRQTSFFLPSAVFCRFISFTSIIHSHSSGNRSVHFSSVLPLFFPVPEVVVHLLLEFVSAYRFPSIYAGLRVFKFPFCTPFGTCLFCLFELK